MSWATHIVCPPISHIFGLPADLFDLCIRNATLEYPQRYVQRHIFLFPELPLEIPWIGVRAWGIFALADFLGVFRGAARSQSNGRRKFSTQPSEDEIRLLGTRYVYVGSGSQVNFWNADS